MSQRYEVQFQAGSTPKPFFMGPVRSFIVTGMRARLPKEESSPFPVAKLLMLVDAARIFQSVSSSGLRVSESDSPRDISG